VLSNDFFTPGAMRYANVFRLQEFGMDVVNKKWSEDYFFQERKKVLNMWPTGKEVHLDEAVEYHKNLPPVKNAVLEVLQAKEKGDDPPLPFIGFRYYRQP